MKKGACALNPDEHSSDITDVAHQSKARILTQWSYHKDSICLYKKTIFSTCQDKFGL